MKSPSSTSASINPVVHRLFVDHRRTWRHFSYVYPVISRRSKGMSIGINLNVDKVCNFDCVYCMVDRTAAPPRRDVDLEQVRDELSQMLDLAVSLAIWKDDAFKHAPAEYQRINDIAFSGDGEPSTFARLDQAVQIAVDAKNARGLKEVKLVLITNASGLGRAATRRALQLLDAHNGQVWAKLDAGTPEFYRLIDRSRYSLGKVLGNILECGRQRPLVIQSLFMKLHGQPTPEGEFDAYLNRLSELLEQGCRIQLVQLYTTARRTAEAYVSPLENAQLDQMAARLRRRLPRLPVEVYYGLGG